MCACIDSCIQNMFQIISTTTVHLAVTLAASLQLRCSGYDDVSASISQLSFSLLLDKNLYGNNTCLHDFHSIKTSLLDLVFEGWRSPVKAERSLAEWHLCSVSLDEHSIDEWVGNY